MNLKLRLIILNFLQFAVWGAYLTSMGNYLGAVGLGSKIGLFYAMQGITPEQLEVDRFHIENDIDFISEQEVFSIVCEAGFETPVRFYQNYLFGGWVTRKCINA